jgi:hypothetical protein
LSGDAGGARFSSSKHLRGTESIMKTALGVSTAALAMALCAPAEIRAATAPVSPENPFDKRCFPGACWVDRVTPGEPGNWQLSLSRRF